MQSLLEREIDAHQAVVDRQADDEAACAELAPRVLADRRDAIRAKVAKPNSDLFEVLHDAWALTLTQNMLDTLIRHAAQPDTANIPRTVSDQNLGRAFRILCETCVDYAAREGLDDAVTAELVRLRQESADDYADMDARR